MKKKLHKITLDFDLTLKYVRSQLNAGQTLASKILTNVHFDEGYFFTLVSQDYHSDILYHFERGGILPQNPILEYKLHNEKATYSIIPTIQDEMAAYLFNTLRTHPNFTCVFDDIIRTADSRWLMDLNNKHLLYSYENEPIFICRSNHEQKTIKLCLKKSNHIWYSLALITTTNLNNLQNKQLNRAEIRNICKQAQIIIVGAYDGEGYVLWEKKDFSL